jgi:hypothetical protein
MGEALEGDVIITDVFAVDPSGDGWKPNSIDDRSTQIPIAKNPIRVELAEVLPANEVDLQMREIRRQLRELGYTSSTSTMGDYNIDETTPHHHGDVESVPLNSYPNRSDDGSSDNSTTGDIYTGVSNGSSERTDDQLHYEHASQFFSDANDGRIHVHDIEQG